MLSGVSVERVYLAAGTTDMRMSINGLAAIVQECFELDPFSTDLYVFCNKNRDRLKILRWQHNGFWLYLRRLDKGKINWPKSTAGDGTIEVSGRELGWLLDGLSLQQEKAHVKLSPKLVV
jgi:transposase